MVKMIDQLHGRIVYGKIHPSNGLLSNVTMLQPRGITEDAKEEC